MLTKLFKTLEKYDTRGVRVVSVFLGIVLGFEYAMWAFGKHAGDQGRIPNIRIHFGSHEFLAHHWFMFSIYALIIYWFFRKRNQLNFVIFFIIAFLFGSIIQGFTYSDWYILFR